MPAQKRTITGADIMERAEYLLIRAERRKYMAQYKRARRIEVGPCASILFESYDTILYQIQEMMAIENGGYSQLLDELHAYNPMIPNGDELTATIMFEIDNYDQRTQFLSRIGGIEQTIFLQFSSTEIFAKPEEDTARTSESGKASAVHFVHFGFNFEQKQSFLSSARVAIGFSHEHYAHSAQLPKSMVEILQAELSA